MKMMPLRHKGINASQVVFGSMSLGGGWNTNPVTQEHVLEAERAVDAAREIGINMYDHADIYTFGKAEETFGKILQAQPSLREEIIIQSKCGIRLQDGDLPGRYDFSKEHILNSVDGILSRLGTEYIDILLLHRPDPLMEPEEIAEALTLLKSAGKVRHFGVSNMNVGQIEFLQRSLPYPIIVNQLQMSLSHLHFVDEVVFVNQAAGTKVNFGAGLLEFSQMQDIQLQAWSPLSQGIFTGKDVSDQPEHIQAAAKLVQDMAEEKETTREAIVLGWLMRHPAMIQPVIGTINPERIKATGDAVRQGQLMTRDEWYKLYVTARGPRLP
ncbi:MULTISPECIES: aldo/keto reductase [unclassified Paenibacillus]|uniref:Aldo/keto reductase family oxidoreductase n=1 Tax=Paenibacillus provencensis TaxID=441151 RepID=A0ABW3PUH7_9BACL|nr:MULTISPECIES: aldo/keto reductase [unclassified Paenibacillus]MCM3128937.1 aldo/keto reductase [Paenibacillus sp. MER 78]SFS50384.1 Predicted oxidoreductase [Paenibacillus sp. 453mf]